METEEINKIELTLEDGKYTYIHHEGNQSALRFNQEWRDLTGDKFVFALAMRVTELHKSLADMTLMARAWQTDFSRISPNSADYDPTYKPEYNKETLEAMRVLKTVKVIRSKDVSYSDSTP